MASTISLQDKADRIEKCGKPAAYRGPDEAFKRHSFNGYLEGLAEFSHCLVAIVTTSYGWYNDGWGGDGELRIEPPQIFSVERVSSFEDYKYVHELDDPSGFSEMDNYSVEWFIVPIRRAKALGL